MAQAITHASYYMTARPGRPALHLPSTLLNARAPASMAGQGSGSLYSGLVPDNQRLEILGDAVIQLGVTRFLCMKCKLPQSLAVSCMDSLFSTLFGERCVSVIWCVFCMCEVRVCAYVCDVCTICVVCTCLIFGICCV